MPHNTKEKRIAYQKQWDKENPEKKARYRKKSHLRLLYGINIEEYNLLFAKQEGKCAICGTHQSGLKKVLSVDHCHETGKVRGLLCQRCNSGIGFLNDDIENLKCAILYLNKED